MGVERLLPIFSSLLDRESAVPKPPKKLPRGGVQVGSEKKSHHKHPAWVVLEVRRLRETRGFSYPRIVNALSARGVEITDGDVNRYVEYQSRPKLTPEGGRREPYGP